MQLEDQEEAFCSNKAKLRGDVSHSSQEFSDLPQDEDICNNPGEKIDRKVGYFPTDEDFVEFPESDTEEEDNSNEDAVQPETPVRVAPADNAPTALNLPDAAPSSPANTKSKSSVDCCETV